MIAVASSRSASSSDALDSTPYTGWGEGVVSGDPVSGPRMRRSGGLNSMPLTGASEQAQVGVDERVACKEGDDGAEREEGRKRNRHLPRLRTVPREQDDRGQQRGDHPEQQRYRHVAPERSPHQKGELDVSHP